MGGARWDDWRTGCPLPTGGAASRPMCQLVWRSGCSAADRTITSSGASAADVPPREPQASDWRGGRAAASTSMNLDFSGPAPGLAGARGGVRDKRAPSEATCERGPIAKRASVMRSMTDEEARDPRARERAATCLSRLCRPDRVASGMEARQGARRRYPGGSTRSATARPRAAGRRPGPPGPGSNGTWAPTAASSGSRCSINSYLGNNGPCPPASNLGDDSPFNETFTPATLATCR